MSRQLIIFVHGLGGDWIETWGAFPTLLQEDADLRGVEIGHFSYPTSLFRLPFFRKAPAVQTLSGGLQTLIKNRYSAHDGITLVCHSLGGIIGKQYLIDQVEQDRPLRIRSLLLYAVPNNGAALATVGKMISWRHGQLRQLCKQADLLRTISTSWQRLKMRQRVNETYVVGGLDTVVSELSARESWGNENVEVIPDCDHRSIVKPRLATDMSYIILKNRLMNPSQKDGPDGEQNNPISFFGGAIPAGGQEVRVSMSALIRIAQDDKYILIRNVHRPETFAPIGGVFKYHREAQLQLDALDFRPQVTAQEMRSDLRGFLPSGNLAGFIKWFSEGHGRENSDECLRRELREELEQAGLPLQSGELDGFRFAPIRAITEGPKPIAGESYLQYRHIEVYDLIAKSPTAQNVLDRIWAESALGKDLVSATSDEIKRGRDRLRHVIGAHTPYLFRKERFRLDDDPAFSG